MESIQIWSDSRERLEKIAKVLGEERKLPFLPLPDVIAYLIRVYEVNKQYGFIPDNTTGEEEDDGNMAKI